MAVRYPLYYSGGNLRELSSAQLEDYITLARYQFFVEPSVRLSTFGLNTDFWTNTTLDGMPLTDTRLQAGAAATSVADDLDETDTDEPTTVTESYSGIIQNVKTALTEPVDSNSRRFPLYRNASGHLQAMTLTDMYDTFIDPAINTLTAADADDGQIGTYKVATTRPTGFSTGTLIFTDTRADTSLYAAADIPEALDQPVTVQSYYIYKRNPSFTVTEPTPLVYANSSSNIQQYAYSDFFEVILRDLITYAAANKTGYKIRYNINGSGITRGTGMTDTILDGSGNFQELFVDADDYRAQEFPNGSPITASTYYLKINRV